MNITLKVLTVFVASIVFINEFLGNKNFISGFQNEKKLEVLTILHLIIDLFERLDENVIIG